MLCLCLYNPYKSYGAEQPHGGLNRSCKGRGSLPRSKNVLYPGQLSHKQLKVTLLLHSGPRGLRCRSGWSREIRGEDSSHRDTRDKG